MDIQEWIALRKLTSAQFVKLSVGQRRERQKCFAVSVSYPKICSELQQIIHQPGEAARLFVYSVFDTLQPNTGKYISRKHDNLVMLSKANTVLLLSNTEEGATSRGQNVMETRIWSLLTWASKQSVINGLATNKSTLSNTVKITRNTFAVSHFEGCVLRRSHLSAAYVTEDALFQKSNHYIPKKERNYSNLDFWRNNSHFIIVIFM